MALSITTVGASLPDSDITTFDFDSHNPKLLLS